MDPDARDLLAGLLRPPRRVDILTSLTGLEFAEAWNDRLDQEVGGLRMPFLGRASLIRNKRATGRPRDLGDLDVLGPE